MKTKSFSCTTYFGYRCSGDKHDSHAFQPHLYISQVGSQCTRGTPEVCLCVCACVCACVCVRVCVCVCVREREHIFTCMYFNVVRARVCARERVCVCVYLYKHKYDDVIFNKEQSHSRYDS